MTYMISMNVKPKGRHTKDRISWLLPTSLGQRGFSQGALILPGPFFSLERDLPPLTHTGRALSSLLDMQPLNKQRPSYPVAPADRSLLLIPLFLTAGPPLSHCAPLTVKPVSFPSMQLPSRMALTFVFRDHICTEGPECHCSGHCVRLTFQHIHPTLSLLSLRLRNLCWPQPLRPVSGPPLWCAWSSDWAPPSSCLSPPSLLLPSSSPPSFPSSSFFFSPFLPSTFPFFFPARASASLPRPIRASRSLQRPVLYSPKVLPTF